MHLMYGTFTKTTLEIFSISALTIEIIRKDLLEIREPINLDDESYYYLVLLSQIFSRQIDKSIIYLVLYSILPKII